MKNLLSVFMVTVLLCLFTQPVSAKESMVAEYEVSYSELEKVAESILKGEKDNLTRFSDLSDEVIDYLEENNINTDVIGEVLYKITDGVPTLIALYYAEKDTLVISSLTSYAETEDGQFVRTAAPGSGDRSWTYGSISGAYNGFSEVTITASINVQCYYVSILEMYYRPYQLVFSYTNKGTNTPTVSNFNVTGIIGGKKYLYSGSTFTPDVDFYYWSTSRTINYPGAGVQYTQTKYMPDGVCIFDMIAKNANGSLYINGQQKTFFISFL